MHTDELALEEKANQRSIVFAMKLKVYKKQKQKQKQQKKMHNQKIGMQTDKMKCLKEKQINTPTSLRCCRTKSLNSPQTLNVLSVKFEHFNLLQWEFNTFGRNLCSENTNYTEAESQ
jgi:hypothetical protein